jgi:hypothetical protein
VDASQLSRVEVIMTGNKSSGSNQFISAPRGGGYAMKGIGEKFSPDLHTGTGNFTIPIALPSGRHGFQPQINLAYSIQNRSINNLLFSMV